jgi:hypothetical protein
MAIYVKPGAYSRFIETAGTVILGTGTRIAAIIATSSHYKTAEETVQRAAVYPTGAWADDLANDNVVTILSVGNFPYSSDYTEGTDFQLVNDTIDWSLGGNIPTAGAKYYVRYTYSKVTADYSPKLLYSRSEAEAEYGVERNDNPMSIALAIFRENGVFPVIAVQPASSTTASFTGAIDKLRYQVEGADPTHLIAISTESVVHTYLYNHCLLMSSQFERKERRAVISTAINTSDASMKAKAEAFASERMIYVPQWCVRTVPTSASAEADYTLDGSYVACAVTAKMLSRNIEESMTNQPIGGFKTLSKVYLESEADALAEKGILLLYTKGGIIKCRHDITTSVATPEENQWSVSEIKDYVIKNVRDVLEKQWLAKPIYGTETVRNVETTTIAALDKLIEGRVIVDYSGITAIQNASDSRRIDVTFNFQPVYPLIWIYINFGFIR